MAASAASGTAVTCNIITVLVSQDSSVFYNPAVFVWAACAALGAASMRADCSARARQLIVTCFAYQKTEDKQQQTCPSEGHLQAIHHPCTPVQ